MPKRKQRSAAKRQEASKKANQRKASRKYRKKLIADPERYEALKEYDRARKAKARAEGRVKDINDLNAKARIEKRAWMREYMRAYHKKQKDKYSAEELVGKFHTHYFKVGKIISAILIQHRSLFRFT